MINYILNKIKTILKNLNHKNNQITLISAKETNNKVICEFKDPLRLDGKLIKHDLISIYRNKSLQKNLDSATLFLLGTLLT